MRRLLPALAVAGLTACAAASTNYTDPAGPRFAGGTAQGSRVEPTIRVATLNIDMGLHLDRLIALLRQAPDLRPAEVVLLQEVDSVTVRAIADSLRMAWVYYPATLHPKSGRDYGNAVLSRFPIRDDWKVPLPYLARGRRTARAAVAATLDVAGHPLRVYSVHLATVIGNTPEQRYAQLRTVLADAEPYPAVVIGGDFNSEAVPEVALQHGYDWPTRRLPPTNAFWTFDHFLVRGIATPASSAAGVVPDPAGASDHRPVWVDLVPSAPSPSQITSTR